MDSDSDLQAYINELSRKTHDLKYDDHKSTSSNDLEPSHSSYIEIAVKKTGLTTDAENIEKQSIQTNKVKELEAKYLKRAIKSSELNLSSSFSEYNLEFEEEKLNTDNINTFPDETTIDSNAKASDKIFFKNTRIQEPPDSIENNKNARQVENLKSHSFEEDIKEDSHHSSQNNNKRKLSDNSSLLNKSSIFYSKNDKPGRQKPTGRIIFRMRSNTLSESDTIKSDVTSSVAEEIPEAMQNEIKETAKTTQMPMEDKDKSNSYEENTFENSEDSSTIKKSVLSQKNSSKSATGATESEQALSEALDGDDNTSERVTSSKGHSSTSPTKETSESSNDIEKSDDSVSQEDSSQSTSVKSEEDRSSPKSSKSSSVNTQSNKSSLQHNHQKVKKDYHKSKNKIEDKKLESSPKSSKSRMKDNKKKQRENDVSKKRSKMKPDSSSSSSSVVTSIQTSSTSSSFYVKMKKNKYREKKRKVKQEKELTELIIKLLIKNLPMILHQTMGFNSRAELLYQQPRNIHMPPLWRKFCWIRFYSKTNRRRPSSNS
ncbi:hypothetical protein Anas_12266 [Armadillidium nasatum]|uniref:Uncharacterized protein n=1 Tax=Armadillidium nasatum TaxID=96803 RepID=A0A5N5SZV9_9CRUS|nr:hypothetical protein Anas_12266 [Armadillidium nasatum]